MSTKDRTQSEKPEDLIWDTYLKAAKGEDEARPKNWQGSTTGILTFTGLFAATVAAFIVESYTQLSPNPSDRTNDLLEHVIMAMANMTSQNPIAPPPPQVFPVPATAVIINVLWFLSLLIALICALLSTLVQQWSRNYVEDINSRQALHDSPRTRAFNHIYIRMGVNRYGMDQFVSWIVALVHLSVFLFACGLLVFLYTINTIVASISTGVLAVMIIIYFAASVLPLIDASCPYRTPVTYMMAFIYWLYLQGSSLFAPMRLWSSEKSTKDKTDLLRLLERHYTGFHWEFMTDTRFVFAWDHTYLHIKDESLETFFKALPSVLNHPSNASIWSRLCADMVFMRRIWLYFDELYRATRADPSSRLVGTDVFELITCLSDRMYATEVEQHGKHLDDSAYTSAYCLDVLGSISQLAEVDGPSQLTAQLCLVHARWAILQLCREAFVKYMPTTSVRDVPNFFREASRTGFRLEHQSPCGILLLLIAGSYQSRSWSHRSTSNLMPLHEDDCCRSWTNTLTSEGLAHVAASNALSTVASFLRSSDDQRRNARSMKLNIHTISEKWDAKFYMPETSRRMPSREFVGVLYSAGLQEWLEPGSEFVSGPAEGPNRRFLTNTYQGKCCVRALRNLAQKVDFVAYRARAAPRFPSPRLVLPSPSSFGPGTAIDPEPSFPVLDSPPSHYTLPPLPFASADGHGRYLMSSGPTGQPSSRANELHSPHPGFARDNEVVFLVDAVRQMFPHDRDEDVQAGLANTLGRIRDTTGAVTVSGTVRSGMEQGGGPSFLELRTIRHSSRAGPSRGRFDADVSQDDVASAPAAKITLSDDTEDTLMPLMSDADMHEEEPGWSDRYGSPRLRTVTIIEDRLRAGTGDAESITTILTDSVREGGTLPTGWRRIDGSQ